MMIQKIARKHGDASYNYDVRVTDADGDEATLSCDSEEKADALIAALERAQYGAERMPDRETGY